MAITMWHPRQLIGGMCHYMLPSCPENKKGNSPNGRYADDVIGLFMKEIENANSRPCEYRVKIFGGGNQFAPRNASSKTSISQNNIQSGKYLLKKHGFSIDAEHIGGDGYRNVIFDISNGDVWMKHVLKLQIPEPCAKA